MLAWKGGARSSVRQSKTEEGRRAAYFERRRRELAEAAGAPHEGGHAPQQQEDELEESYDVLQLRFLVELAPATEPAEQAEPGARVEAPRIAGPRGLIQAALEAPAQPTPSGLRHAEHAAASSLGGYAASPAEPLLTRHQEPSTWHQQPAPASPPRAAPRYATPPPRKPAAGALDLSFHQLASFSHGGDDAPEASYRPEPMVAMPFVPTAPAAAPQPEADAASPERTESSWLVATAAAGAAAIAAGQGFRTPPRGAWANSDDEAEAERLDATVSLLLDHGGDDQAAPPLRSESDFGAFAAARRAALRPGDGIMSHDAFQHGGFLPSDHGVSYGGDANADAAVRMQRSYTQHTGGSWPMLVTTEERLEVSFFPSHHGVRVAQRPAAPSCRITECDDDDEGGLSDLGALLAQRVRDGAGGDAARGRSFHMPAALLGGTASPEPLRDSPVQQRAAQAAAGACVEPSQVQSPLSPQLSSPRSPAADDGGGCEAGAWAAAARFVRQLNVGTDAAAPPQQAGGAAAAAEHGVASRDEQPGCALAPPAAPADAAAAPAEATPPAARETRGARQLRAALAAPQVYEPRQRSESAEYVAQLESAVLQLLACKAAAQQSGDDGAPGSGWPHTVDAAVAAPPAVVRC